MTDWILYDFDEPKKPDVKEADQPKRRGRPPKAQDTKDDNSGKAD